MTDDAMRQWAVELIGAMRDDAKRLTEARGDFVESDRDDVDTLILVSEVSWAIGHLYGLSSAVQQRLLRDLDEEPASPEG